MLKNYAIHEEVNGAVRDRTLCIKITLQKQRVRNMPMLAHIKDLNLTYPYLNYPFVWYLRWTNAGSRIMAAILFFNLTICLKMVQNISNVSLR